MYPAQAGDFSVALASTGLFRAKWTHRIHAKWIDAAIRQQPQLERDRLERAAELMNFAVPGCLVTGFEPIEAALSLPDPEDRHVLAAAIHCGAQQIVTFNTHDFPDAVLRPYGIRAVHPDLFVQYLLDLDAETVYEAIGRIRRRHGLANLPWSTQ